MTALAKKPAARKQMRRPHARAGATHPLELLPGADYVGHFVDRKGMLDVDRIADVFGLSKSQLAESIGLAVATISKADRKAAPRTQARVREMIEILSRIRAWAGGEVQALAWYRSQPIPPLDGRTAEALVKAGEAGAVRAYLDHLALGGFA